MGEIIDLVPLPEDPRKDRVKYPLWDIAELERDKQLAFKNIAKFETAIQEQHALIRERDEQIANCRERDQKLNEYFAELKSLKKKYGDEVIDNAIRGA